MEVQKRKNTSNFQRYQKYIVKGVLCISIFKHRRKSVFKYRVSNKDKVCKDFYATDNLDLIKQAKAWLKELNMPPLDEDQCAILTIVSRETVSEEYLKQFKKRNLIAVN